MSRSLGIALAAITLISSAVYAQPNRPMVRGDAVVAYRDLDLRSRAGAEVMLKRIEHAATVACGDNPAMKDPKAPWIMTALHDFHVCREDAMRRAVISLGAPLVTQLYAESRSDQSRVAGR